MVVRNIGQCSGFGDTSLPLACSLHHRFPIKNLLVIQESIFQQKCTTYLEGQF